MRGIEENSHRQLPNPDFFVLLGKLSNQFVGFLNQALICREETMSVAHQDFYKAILPHLGLGIISISAGNFFLEMGKLSLNKRLF